MSQWNNICWNHHCTGGGIQYLTSRVVLDFLVVSDLSCLHVVTDLIIIVHRLTYSTYMQVHKPVH